MNANEALLVNKMVQHLNVINQYVRILHEHTYDEIFRAGGTDLTVYLDEVRANMLAALEKAGDVGHYSEFASRVSPLITVSELGQILANQKG